MTNGNNTIDAASAMAIQVLVRKTVCPERPFSAIIGSTTDDELLPMIKIQTFAGSLIAQMSAAAAFLAEASYIANGKPLLFPDDPDVVGIATDTPVETTLPRAHLDDIAAVAAMMLRSAIPVEDVLAKCGAEG